MAYCVAVALFLEATTRLAFRSDTFFQLVFGDDDASWRLAWVRNHIRHRPEYAGVDQYHPTRGWALRPDLRSVRLHRGLVSSNSKGVRGTREYDYAKPAGATRIVVLGDSFTFGEEVDDRDTYAYRLAEKLPGVEVLNLGVHGYGNDQMLIYLREEGLGYQPDVVIIGVVSQDMARNVLSFRDYAKPHFVVLEGGRLALRNSPVPSPEEVLRAEVWRSRLADALTMLWHRFRALSGVEKDAKHRLTLALLDELGATIEAAGGKPVYLYVPVGTEIEREDPVPTKRKSFFLSYCRERKRACVDPAERFLRRVQEGARLKTKGHWDAEEHDLAAEAIAAYLLEQRIVPRP